MTSTTHPEYVKRQRKARVLGVAALGAGVLGVALPVLPGVLFLLVGLSILSVRSSHAHRMLARLRARHPTLEEPMRALESWLHHTLDLSTHTHEYVTLPVREGASVHAVVERSEIAGQGIAILLHSASGTMDMPLMHGVAEVFRARGLTVVRFNASCGIATPEAYPTFTVTNYLEDLIAVVVWVRAQEWGTAPLTLVGHSIGGLVAGMYAAREGNGVQELYLLAPTLSGQVLKEAYAATGVDLMAWEEAGVREVAHPLSAEKVGQGYGLVADAQQYDLYRHAPSLTMPVRLVCGEADPFAPEDQCKHLAEAIGAQATLTVVPNIPHTPVEQGDIKRLADALGAF